MPDNTYTIQLTEVERAQLDKLAEHEQCDPADLLRPLFLEGLHAWHERRRVAEIERSGRRRRPK